MRTIKWIFLSLIIIVIILYFTGSFIARRLLEYGLEYVEPELANQGIIVKQFGYGTILLHSINSISISDVDILVDLNKEIYGKKSFTTEFSSESIIIRITNLKDPSIRLVLKDFDLYIQPNDKNPDRPFGKFENAYWRSEIPVKLYDVKTSGEILVEKLNALFRENSVPDLVDFRADALLNIDGQDIKIRLFTYQNNGRTFLRFNKDDLLNASKAIPDMEISEVEAEVISQYPARALHILKITRDARRLSSKEKSKRENFPDDAFKHLYWSYHLTKTFGPDFAKEITDAHETLPNNTPQQRKMDFHNNKIGREIASKEYSIGDLKNIVLNSPDIIRSPEQIQ